MNQPPVYKLKHDKLRHIPAPFAYALAQWKTYKNKYDRICHIQLVK